MISIRERIMKGRILWHIPTLKKKNQTIQTAQGLTRWGNAKP